MNRILAALGLITAILALSGCGPIYQSHYNYTPPNDWRGRTCVNQCLADRSNCRAQCATRNQACKTNAQLVALPAYINYQQGQNKAGLPVTENVNDFADTSQCNGDCGCGNTYRDCFTNCGGTITVSTVCTAFCPPPAQNNLMPKSIR